MNTERQPGYYWCKLQGNWVVGLFDGNLWRVAGFNAMVDEAFDKIIITRIEPPQEHNLSLTQPKPTPYTQVSK